MAVCAHTVNPHTQRCKRCGEAVTVPPVPGPVNELTGSCKVTGQNMQAPRIVLQRRPEPDDKPPRRAA